MFGYCCKCADATPQYYSGRSSRSSYAYYGTLYTSECDCCEDALPQRLRFTGAIPWSSNPQVVCPTTFDAHYNDVEVYYRGIGLGIIELGEACIWTSQVGYKITNTGLFSGCPVGCYDSPAYGNLDYIPAVSVVLQRTSTGCKFAASVVWGIDSLDADCVADPLQLLGNYVWVHNTVNTPFSDCFAEYDLKRQNVFDPNITVHLAPLYGDF